MMGNLMRVIYEIDSAEVICKNCSMTGKFVHFFRVFTALLFSLPFHASAAEDGRLFPFLPRVSALGLTGDYSLLWGDIMLPIARNDRDVWYIDLQPKSAFKTSWLAGMGTGVRITPDGHDQIWGAYLFFDRTVSSQNKTFWFVAPGVESLGRVWDFRLNGYVPISPTRALINNGFADEFGNFDFVQFVGHDQFDAMLANYEEVGWGLDGEIGRTLPFIPNLRAYVGGYHFNFQNAEALNGFSGRLEYSMNRFISLSLWDTYDNQRKNVFEVGLQLTLGGTAPSRLLDPIPRNLATLGQGNGEPVIDVQQIIPINNGIGPNHRILERSNIWFFETVGGTSFVNSSSCTAEAPCSLAAFNQNTITTINGFMLSPPVHPSFYFKQGSYSALNGALPDILSNDSLFSRTSDYKSPALGAIFNGAFDVYGTSTMEMITLLNDQNTPQPYALNLHTGGKLTLTGAIIGPSNNDLTISYPTGVQMQDSILNVTQNSQIYTFTKGFSGPVMPSIGINAIDSVGSQITIDNSQIFSTVSALSSTNQYTAQAIATQNQPSANASTTITIQNGSSINASAIDNFGLITVAGIAAAESTNNVNISGASNVNGNATIIYGNTINTYAVLLNGSSNTLQVSGNSNLTATINLTTGLQFVPNDLVAETVEVIGTNNQINIQGGSQLNASINSQYSELAVARAIDVSDQGAANTQITVDNSPINVNVNVSHLEEGSALYAVEADGINIDTTAASGLITNTINLNNTPINANAFVQDTFDTNYPNKVLAQGIYIGSHSTTNDNMTNTVNTSDSNLFMTAQISLSAGQGNAANPYNPTTVGINLNSGDNSTNTVNLNAVDLQTNSVVDTGSQNYDILTATGISETTGANSTNNFQINNNSTISANSQLMSAGALSEQLTSYGVNATSGTNSSNVITIGTAGNLNDSTTVTGSATIGSSSSSNVENMVTAYGININGTGGVSGTNTLLVQGNAAIDGIAQINNSGGNTGQSSANSWGIYTTNTNNSTTLNDSSSLLSSAAGTGSLVTVTAIGIESVALGGFNDINNWDVTNNNITALQNGVNNGQKIKLSF